MEHHRWLVGAQLHDVVPAVAARGGNGHSPEVYLVDCDARRGPFAATADLVRQIMPALRAQDPAAVRAHAVELVSLVPDLWAAGEALRLPPVNAEHAGYSVRETLLIAHGIVDLLHAWSAALGRSIVIYDNVELADPTELELLALALHRMPPELVELVVRSRSRGVGEPLAAALRCRAVQVDAPTLPAGPGAEANRP